jgi:hypothetical protein
MDDLKTQFDMVVQDALSEVDFDVDGVVFEITIDLYKEPLSNFGKTES